MSKHSRILALFIVVSLIPLGIHAAGAEPNQPSTIADCLWGGWRNYEHAGFRNTGDCIRFVRTDVFTCRDALGCVSYGEAQPVRLVTALVTSGPYATLGIDELRGVEIALDIQGDLLGHAVQLRNEDSMCSAEGGQAAAMAIAGDPTIAAVVGTTCSVAAFTAAPIISDAGLSMVSPSNTNPVLSDPTAHADGYLRVAWNDRDQAIAMAEYVYAQDATTAAVVVDGSMYSGAMGDVFVAAFEDLGGGITVLEVANPGGGNVVDVVNAIVSAGPPDMLYMPVFEPLGYALVTEVRSRLALDATQLAASDALASQGFVDSLGGDGEGMLFTAPDPSFTETPEYAAFAAAYLAEYLEDPLTLFSAFAFDAANVILGGIEAVAVVDGDNTLHIGRGALRDALFATSGFEGLTGTITCNVVGDCASIGFVILTVDGGVLVPVP